MTNKSTKSENIEWRDQIFSEPDKTKLDIDQRTIVNNLSTISALIQEKMEKIDSDISGLPEGHNLSERDPELYVNMDGLRADLVDAMDMVYCLITGQDHPIFRFASATISTQVRGRKMQPFRELYCRAISAGFVEGASEVLGISKNEAAKIAAEQLNALGLGPRTAAGVKAYYGNGFGHLPVDIANSYAEQFKQTPRDKVVRYFRFWVARHHDRTTVKAALDHQD